MISDPKTKLLIAILSMDSYNRDYGAGISGLGGAGSKIGSAILQATPAGINTDTWQSTGFYAAAYTTPDGTVISYRGTDAAPDYTKGWPIAAGDIGSDTQAPQSLAFYEAVTGKTYSQGAAPNVILTGHSLGGLLAGYVAALSGTDALTFDHAPFGIAAAAKYILDNGLPQNPADWTSYLHLSQIKGEFVDNEILESARNGDVQSVAGAILGGLASLLTGLGYSLTAIGSSLSALTVSIENYITKTPIESYSGISELSFNPLTAFSLADRALKLHMMDYLVNLKFAAMDDGGNGPHVAWHKIGVEFANSYFNNDIGRLLGWKEAGQSDGASTPAGKMGRSIAYSTLDGTEGLVFGNSGARSMFNDLDDIGDAYSNPDLNPILNLELGTVYNHTPLKQAFANIAVEYAGALAKYKVEIAKAKQQVPELDVTQGVFGEGVNHNTLTLDVSSVLWHDVFKDAPGQATGLDANEQPTYPNPLYADEIRKLHLSQFSEFTNGGGLSGPLTLNTSLVSAFVSAMWDKSGTDAYKAIDRFHFRVPADDFTEALSDRSYKVVDGRGDGVHIDAYQGLRC
jgi:hypothetical protein